MSLGGERVHNTGSERCEAVEQLEADPDPARRIRPKKPDDGRGIGNRRRAVGPDELDARLVEGRVVVEPERSSTVRERRPHRAPAGRLDADRAEHGAVNAGALKLCNMVPTSFA